MAGHGLFLGAAAFGVALTVITEGLSLGNRLTPGWLGASWGLAGGLALWALRARRSAEPRVARATPMSRGVPGVIGTILAVTGAIALLSPPNLARGASSAGAAFADRFREAVEEGRIAMEEREAELREELGLDS